MFDQLRLIFTVDWRIFQTATSVWWRGGNPYGVLSPEFDSPGLFAYPPTALTWLSVFLPLGAAGFWVWTGLLLGAWRLLSRRSGKNQNSLLIWSPVLVHFVLGQSTLAIVLAVWAVYLAPRRSWGCGLLLAFALTKPQAALLPVAWLLWCERRSPQMPRLGAGLILGTLLLALPPTVHNPRIWQEWIGSLGAYRQIIQQTAPWQGFGLLVLLPTAWLWWRQQRQAPHQAPLQSVWPWFLTAALFPQTGVYPAVVLLPALHPRRNYWTIAGLALASLLVAPITSLTLPLFLSGQILSGWLINGGPSPRFSEEKL